MLWLLGRANLPGMTDTEVCQLSVIERGTLPDISDIKNLPPLKCKTEKTCVTSETFGKGKCEGGLGKDFETLRISSDNAKKENEIKKIFADGMADCWNMMGQGKIQVFEREILTLGYDKRCVICSRIVFDDTIEAGKINGMAEYLYSHNVPGQTKSYFNFMTNSEKSDTIKESVFSDPININEKAVVFVEADSGKFALVGTALGGAAVGGTIAVAVIGTGGGVLVLSGAGATLFYASVGAGAIGGYTLQEQWNQFIKLADYTSSVQLIDYTPEEIERLGCDSLESVS